MKNIVIFGGVFDPPHLGHLSIYKAIKKHLKFEKFIILPSKNPPLKASQPIASASDRVEMLNLMFAKYQDVVIDKYEMSLPKNKISYTIDTLKIFKRKYPNHVIYFAIGSDRYQDFKQWREWKTILKIAKLIVVKRKNVNVQKDIPAMFIDINPIRISSSELRQLPNHKYLDKQVLTYIATKGLYINEQIKPLISKKRYEHTLRVCTLSLEICKKYPTLLNDCYIASMYHDIAKEFDDKKVLSLSGNYDKKRFHHVHMLHGVAGANYIKRFYNIRNKRVLTAIANHVVPPKNPSILAMIIYCADKLEPARTNKDVSNRLQYIKQAKTNLKACYCKLYKEINSHYN